MSNPIQITGNITINYRHEFEVGDVLIETNRDEDGYAVLIVGISQGTEDAYDVMVVKLSKGNTQYSVGDIVYNTVFTPAYWGSISA